MLTELYQALTTWLSGFDAPLYLADCVPAETAFPYLTASMSVPLSSGEAGALTLTLWCHGDAANTERFHLSESLAEHLPARGFRIALKDGTYTLRMKAGPTHVHSQEALGMKTVWTFRCYPAV